MLVYVSVGDQVSSIAFSADGSLLVTATAEQLAVYDAATGALLSTLPCASSLSQTLSAPQLDFSADGLLLVRTSSRCHLHGMHAHVLGGVDFTAANCCYQSLCR